MNKRLRDEVLELPPEERLKLLGDLWDSLEAIDLSPLSADQIQELDRRLALHDADPSRAVPWEEARARLRARYG